METASPARGGERLEALLRTDRFATLIGIQIDEIHGHFDVPTVEAILASNCWNTQSFLGNLQALMARSECQAPDIFPQRRFAPRKPFRESAMTLAHADVIAVQTVGELREVQTLGELRAEIAP